MALLRLTLALLSAATFAGCATYQKQDLSPADVQVQFDERSLRDPSLRQFLAAHGQPATDEWDLPRLSLAALYFSPQLDLARARVAEAEATARTAKDLPNPTFSFTPGYNMDAAGGVTPWILGYALSLPLELAGKRTHRAAEAQFLTEAARLDLASVAWKTRSAVRGALTEMHRAEAMSKHWRETQPLFTRVADLIAVQVKAGEVSPLEVAQARVAVHQAELAARESERAVAAARSRLAEAVGIPLSALTEARLSYRGLSEPAENIDYVAARRWAAQNRADLLAALASYAATQSALQAEVVRNYADLNLGPGYDLDQGDGKWLLALGVTLPIFHRNEGPLAQAKARREVAAAQFLALQNRVLAEVDRAHADYDAARRNLATAQALCAEVDRQAKAVAARLAAGDASRLALVQAQVELAHHFRAELEVRLRAEQALGAFEDAVQRPLAWPDTAWRNSVRAAAK